MQLLKSVSPLDDRSLPNPCLGIVDAWLLRELENVANLWEEAILYASLHTQISGGSQGAIRQWLFM